MYLSLVTSGVLPVLVAFLVLRQPVVRLCPHGLGEVAEGLGVVQVQLLHHITNIKRESARQASRQMRHRRIAHLGVKVGQNPGEDRVLHQVIVGASRQRVEVHQVLEVTDLPSLEKKHPNKSGRDRTEDEGLTRDTRGFLPPNAESLTSHPPKC